MRRHDAPGWMILLSLALHLVVLLALLARPLERPPVAASEPIPVDFVMEAALADAVTEAGSQPAAAAAAAPSAEPPAPVPDMPAPPIQQAEAPPPEPAPAPETPVPPAQQTEPPPPDPAPAPSPPPPEAPPPSLPVPPPPVTPPRPPFPAPVPQARPPRPAPPRTVTRPAAPRGSGSPAEAPATPANDQGAASRANLASNGAAWMGRLKQWWDQNSFYPREASQTNEGGSVRVRIAIAGDGQVTAISVVQGSGSSVLDAAAVAVFRGARLPPLPPGAPPQPADVVITLHYRPGDSGR